jgi:hypothetical protein
MTKYVVAAAALGVPTGKEDRLTRLPQVVRFVRGQVVDSEKFDHEDSQAKIERLLKQGALRDPEDVPAQAQQVYQSDFDIPLDRDPAAPENNVVKLPGDDIDDEGEDATDAVWVPPQPSLVDGTPEARLQGTAVRPEDTDGTHEEPSEADDGEELPAPPSRGASTAVWQQYAERIDLGTAPDASRTEIQEAYDAKVAEQPEDQA